MTMIGSLIQKQGLKSYLLLRCGNQILEKKNLKIKKSKKLSKSQHVRLAEKNITAGTLEMKFSVL